jgi:hypothetical protein
VTQTHNAFIAKTMGYAAKMYENHNQAGNLHPTATKADAISSAAKTGMKLLQSAGATSQSSGGGSIAGNFLQKAAGYVQDIAGNGIVGDIAGAVKNIAGSGIIGDVLGFLL